MLYILLLIKRFIEDIGMFPFIWWGRRMAARKPLEDEYDLFFFFPFYHVGGAEKVNAEIVQQFPGKRIIIFFTKHSQDEALLHLFQAPNITIRNIAPFADNKKKYYLSFIYRGLISAYINKQSIPPTVFNGQSNFGYKISRWINKGIPQVELLHNFCNFSYIRLPFLQFYKRSITVSQRERDMNLAVYRKFGLPKSLEERFIVIGLAIHLPAMRELQNIHSPIKILYVGRGTAEKRPTIVAQVAERVHRSEPGIEFLFMGDVKDAIPLSLHKHVKLLGSIGDPKQVEEIYRSCNVLIIPSSRESGPLVFMEGMAYAMGIIASPVGIMPYHYQKISYGLQLDTVHDIERIIAETARQVLEWNADPQQLKLIASKNREYAYQHFGMDTFHQAYKDLINHIRELP